ncbi:sce7725 family protein [Clostridium botulinum]|uniref:sce7725 family protein n=1 Tax=Clostridium botulinum TaxID=1491 RepID=UPI0013C7AA97|nr:sce7725 family protein [Clostridium botulinum]MBY7025061.1 sce7725 family protein [Clostridium botulinum]NFE73841.1 sce7725 family protein [Clostridium botulinum]NFG26055.1 sce7725 family protein [Clostridium botulinum]NFL60526.1 sce7725 family protein [Clostridium botulinum]NFL63750.1 sce7725 family protein [Clostridium botulinum]
MYFPYLRGRQYELIALRELLDNKLIGNKIIPVIEPIKLSATLIKTIQLFNSNKNKIAIICNPQVGSFKNSIGEIKGKNIYKEYKEAINDSNVIKSHIINKNSYNEINELVSLGLSRSELLVVADNLTNIDNYINEFNEEPPKYSLVPDEIFFRRKVKNNRVIFKDRFIKRDKNSDYSGIEEAFSEDHLFYSEEGYSGFSDFSIVGSSFSESGFAPFAVAIHIVYFDDNKALKMKHFVSKSNDDISNPAKKFYEALQGLYLWSKEQPEYNINTLAMEKFLDHYKKQTYPGLGTVKKLAIMHHIELINRFLN